MKRVLISILGTVAGITALLSFKTHTPAGTDLGLPSAGLPVVPGSTATTTAPGAVAPAGSGSRPAGATARTRAPMNATAAGTRTPGASRHAAAGAPAGSVHTPANTGAGVGAGSGRGATSTAPRTAPSSPAGTPTHPAGSTPPAERTTTAAPPPPPPVSHTYTGQAVRTRYGTVQVAVTMTGSSITNVSFVQLSAADSRSQQINANAGPVLLQQTLAAQSAQIDGVSGATYTTQGYEQSLQSALDQA